MLFLLKLFQFLQAIRSAVCLCGDHHIDFRGSVNSLWLTGEKG